MPANLITLAHFSVSSAISLPNSAGDPASATPPRSIGSGPGLLASEMATLVGRNGRVCGIDISEDMLTILQLVTYAAHARANARVCSLGKEPDVTSSRVCLPPSSLTNESSQYVCGAFVKAILTVCCSRKSVIVN